MSNRFSKSLAALAVAAVFTPVAHAAWYANQMSDNAYSVVLHEGVTGHSIVTGVYKQVIAGKRPLRGMPNATINSVTGLNDGSAVFDGNTFGPALTNDVTLSYTNEFNQSRTKTYTRGPGIILYKSGWPDKFNGMYNSTTRTLEVLGGPGFTKSDILLPRMKVPSSAGALRAAIIGSAGNQEMVILTTSSPISEASNFDELISKRALIPEEVGIVSEILYYDIYYDNIGLWVVNTEGSLFNLQMPGSTVGAQSFGVFTKMIPASGLMQKYPETGYDDDNYAVAGGLAYSVAGIPYVQQIGGDYFKNYELPPDFNMTNVVAIAGTFATGGASLLSANGENLEVYDMEAGAQEALRPIPYIKELVAHQDTDGKVILSWDNDLSSIYTLDVDGSSTYPTQDGVTVKLTSDQTASIPDSGAGVSVNLTATNGVIEVSASTVAFKNLAPTAVVASGNGEINNTIEMVPTVTDPNDGNDVYTFAILTQPANGTAVAKEYAPDPEPKPEFWEDAWGPWMPDTPALIKVITYTPSLDWAGTDTFDFSVTDKAGATVTGTATVNVDCPGITGGVATVNPGAYGTAEVGVTWSANTCNVALAGKLTITNKLNDMLYEETQINLASTGGSDSTTFNVPAMPTGDHIWTLTLTGKSTVPNVKTTTGAYPVNTAVMPVLQVTKDKYSVEELASVSVVPGEGSNCVMTLDEAAARLDRGVCLVEWINVPEGMAIDPNAVAPTIKGFGVANAAAVAGIRVSTFNIAGQKSTIGEVTKTLEFTEAVQPVFDIVMGDGKPLSFDRFADVATLQVVRTDTDASKPCNIYNTLNAATTAAAQYGRSCLFEATQLPDGLKVVESGQGALALKGRLVGDGQQTIGYKVTRIHSVLDAKVVQEATKTVDVLTPTMDFTPVVKSAILAATVQSADITIKTAGANRCTLTTIERDAIDSTADNNNLKCLVEWSDLPAGLVQDVTTTLPKLKGAPTEIGMSNLGYRVSLTSGTTNKLVLKTGTVPLTAVAPEAPTYELVFAELVAGSGVIGIKSNGTVGTLKVTKADIGAARILIESAGAESIPYNNLTINMARDIAAPSTKVWQKRDVKVTVSYMDYPALKSERTMTVVALPPVLQPSVTLPPLLTSVAAQLSMKIPSYSLAMHGEWVGSMEAQDATGAVVWSQADLVMNSAGVGGASIENPAILSGTTMYAVIRAKSSVEGFVLEYRSKGVPVTVQEGGAPTATLQIKTTKGVAPFLATATAVVPAEKAKLLGTMTWYISSDAGVNWSAVSNNTGTSLRTTMKLPGKYQIKAKLPNRYSGVISWTDIKDYEVFTANSVVVSGKTVALVGSPLTLHAESAATLIKWSITKADGTVSTATGADVTLESTAAQVMKVTATVSSETGTALDDPLAWTMKKVDVTFAAPTKMFLDVTGIKNLEIGKAGELTGVVRTPWNNVIAGLEIQGFWTLPDDSKVQGLNLIWTPTLSDYENSRLPVFTAFVTGFEDSTKTTFTPKLYVKKYAFPTFTLDGKDGIMEAPALVRVQVNAPKEDLKLFSSAGGKLRYTWSAPDNAIGFKASSSSAYFTADTAGEYSVTVKVEDARGNVQDIETKMMILEPSQFTYTFKTYASNQYMREPVTVLMRPMLAGGHPKERISNMKFMMDGVSIGESTKGSLSVVIPTAGDYALSFEAATSLGRTVTGTKSLTVAANKPPICVLSIKGNTAISVNAECRDPDGKIKSYAWKVDGVAMSTSGYRISTKKGVAVEVTVTDDSGAAVVYSGNT